MARVCIAAGNAATLSARSQDCEQLQKVLQLTSMVRMGSWMMGPLPLEMSNGMFIPVRGVRMSEKSMTPSGWKARQGCNDISTCMRGGQATHFLAGPRHKACKVKSNVMATLQTCQ